MGILSFFRNLFGFQKQSSAPTLEKSISSESFAVISASCSLAASTVKAAETFMQMDSCKYLCKSKATRTDTAIFSCFIIRALCIMSTNNRSAAWEFSDTYVSSVIRIAQDTFSLDKSFQQQFDNRVAFYDSVFEKKQGIDSKLSAIIEEFEYIIKADIIAGAFAPFSETSPLPILGIFDDMNCQIEVSNYFQFLLAHNDSELTNTFEIIK